MSEDEKKQRLGYRIKRKRLITLQAVILAAVVVAMLIAAVFAVALNKTYYVNYTEKSSIDYGVHLKENDFYEDSYLGKDYAYIASLIDKIQAKFKYEIAMESKNPIKFDYTYRVDAVVQIRDIASGKTLFAPIYSEIAPKRESVSAVGVSVNQTALVDYAKYNDIASKFIDTYDLEGVDANLLLQMHVDIVETSDEFHNDKNKNSYVSSVSIPLTARTVEVKITSAIPPEEQKILSFTTENVAEAFRIGAFMLAAIGAILALIIMLYAYFSRNVDITYDIKVARLVRNYKSFIQKIRNHFNISGYQVLLIDTFEEMLEIRDTIESPILMEENRDKTCTKFFIPTNTQLLYLYEIKVDDYDEIYGTGNENECLSESFEEDKKEPVIEVKSEKAGDVVFIAKPDDKPFLDENDTATASFDASFASKPEIKEPETVVIKEELKKITEESAPKFEMEAVEVKSSKVENAASDVTTVKKSDSAAPKKEKKTQKKRVVKPEPPVQPAIPVVMPHIHAVPIVPVILPPESIVVSSDSNTAVNKNKYEDSDDGSSIITFLLY